MKSSKTQKAYLAFTSALTVLVLATAASAAGPSPVDLRTAGEFAILTETVRQLACR